MYKLPELGKKSLEYVLNRESFRGTRAKLITWFPMQNLIFLVYEHSNNNIFVYSIIKAPNDIILMLYSNTPIHVLPKKSRTCVYF